MHLPYDSKKDIEPVQLIGTAPAILAKSASRPWKTFQELLAAAKEKPNSISYASTGIGSIGHLAMTALSSSSEPFWHGLDCGGDIAQKTRRETCSSCLT